MFMSLVFNFLQTYTTNNQAVKVSGFTQNVLCVSLRILCETLRNSYSTKKRKDPTKLRKEFKLI